MSKKDKKSKKDRPETIHDLLPGGGGAGEYWSPRDEGDRMRGIVVRQGMNHKLKHGSAYQTFWQCDKPPTSEGERQDESDDGIYGWTLSTHAVQWWAEHEPDNGTEIEVVVSGHEDFGSGAMRMYEFEIIKNKGKKKGKKNKKRKALVD